ncbi:MAG: heparinase II/III family protein [Hyphomicrobiales bacterium]
MSVQSISERARLTASVTGSAGLAVKRLFRSRLMRWRYRGPAINQLILVPQDLRTADPSFFSEIYHGQCGLAGRVAYIGTASPFEVLPPSAEWEIELHGFGWLRNLTAAGDQIAREHARALVRDWISMHRQMSGISWRAEIVARRVISWISHSSLLLQGADTDHYDTVMESLAEQIRFLRNHWREAPEGDPRLTALIALQLAGLAAAEFGSLPEETGRAFSGELRRQVLPDGGHVSRNPSVLIELLLDLLPLKQCFISRDVPPPQELVAAIDRMMPMIRFFRMGDGSLARFNGCGVTVTDALATVIAYDDNASEPVAFAEPSGYCRLEQAGTVVIADVGPAPPASYSAAAHAGCLSFEMSTGGFPVIVNCGAPAQQDPDWRRVVRTTVAHSTLSVGNEASARFLAAPIGESTDRVCGPGRVAASMVREENGLSLSASHDGYESRFGIVHHRRLVLSPNGDLLEGEDKLVAPQGLKGEARGTNGAFLIRFHLHPDVRPVPDENGKTVLLVLRDNTAWALESRLGRIDLEPSAFLADERGPRSSWQAVIRGGFQKDAREVRADWLLSPAPGNFDWAALVEEAGGPMPEEATETA